MASTPPNLLDGDLLWLEQAIQARCLHHFSAGETAGAGADPALPPPPPLPRRPRGGYAETLVSLAAGPDQRLLLLLALAPHLAPELLDPFLIDNQATGRRFTEFGGLVGSSHSGLLPTVETALFLLAGRNRQRRLAMRGLFHPAQPLLARGFLRLDGPQNGDPPGAARLSIPPDQLERLLDGDPDSLPPSEGFPAERLSTGLKWDDLILDGSTAEALEMVHRWLDHAPVLLHEWGLARRLKPGFRCLFHGPPGTGKTLSACLLGQRHGLPVYRVDLSRVVSK